MFKETKELTEIKRRMSSGEMNEALLGRYKELKNKKKGKTQSYHQDREPIPKLKPRMSFFATGSSKSLETHEEEEGGGGLGIKPIKRSSSSFFGPTKAEKLALEIEEKLRMEVDLMYCILIDEVVKEEGLDVLMEEEEKSLNMQEKLLRAKKKAEKAELARKCFEEERLRVAREEAIVLEEEMRIKSEILAEHEEHKYKQQMAEKEAKKERERQEKAEKRKKMIEEEERAAIAKQNEQSKKLAERVSKERVNKEKTKKKKAAS